MVVQSALFGSDWENAANLLILKEALSQNGLFNRSPSFGSDCGYSVDPVVPRLSRITAKFPATRSFL
jgi:hypothetical protein